MNDRRYLTAAEMDSYRRRLRDYCDTYPDSDFLDNAADLAGSGRAFTAGNAAKVDDALRNWAERLNRPRFDPDRCPPGCDPHIWKLATLYRTQIEAQDLRCPSRRLIYAEIARIIDRDRLRENYAPWRDEPGQPGWYRMMHAVIFHFAQDADETSAWYGHEALAQPGTVTAVIAYLKDNAKTARFAEHAQPANIRLPTDERRARVRAYIKGRNPRG